MLPKYPKHGRIKEKRLQDKKHLDAIRALPCCCCFEDRSDTHRASHHLMHGQVRGWGLKAPDSAVIPLCSLHHTEAHACGDETAFFRLHGIGNANALSADLYAVSGDYGAMLAVLVKARD